MVTAVTAGAVIGVTTAGEVVANANDFALWAGGDNASCETPEAEELVRASSSRSITPITGGRARLPWEGSLTIKVAADSSITSGVVGDTGPALTAFKNGAGGASELGDVTVGERSTFDARGPASTSILRGVQQPGSCLRVKRRAREKSRKKKK